MTKRGFARTRVGDVADALGVSTALIFYHFGTKEKLFAEALEHAVKRDLDRLDDAVAKASGPGRRGAPDAAAVVAAGQRERLDGVGGRVGGVAARAGDARDEPTPRRDLEGGARRPDHPAATRPGLFRCADPEGAAWRLSALLDGLAVQVMVHRNLTKKQLAVVGARRGRGRARGRRRPAASDRTSHHPVRLVVRVGEAGTVEAERADVGRRRAVDGDVGEQPAEGRGELVAVRGAEADRRPAGGRARARRRSRGRA